MKSPLSDASGYDVSDVNIDADADVKNLSLFRYLILTEFWLPFSKLFGDF